MQKCHTCNTAFTWRQVNSSLTKGYQPIICQQCGAIYTITASSRLINSIAMALLPMVIAFYSMSALEISFWLSLGLLLVLIILATIVTPYLVKYKKVN